jgi:hypothetical protein
MNYPHRQFTDDEAQRLYDIALAREQRTTRVPRPRYADLDAKAASNLRVFHAEIHSREIGVLCVLTILVYFALLLALKFVIDCFYK